MLLLNLMPLADAAASFSNVALPSRTTGALISSAVGLLTVLSSRISPPLDRTSELVPAAVEPMVKLFAVLESNVTLRIFQLARPSRLMVPSLATAVELLNQAVSPFVVEPVSFPGGVGLVLQLTPS